MAIELASAYVSLIPSADGMQRAISRELDLVERESSASGGRAGKGFGGGFASAAVAVGAGTGVALGAAVLKGTADAISREAAGDLLASRLGLTDTADIERIGRVQGEVFASGYGESLADVGAAIEAINANIDDVENIGDTGLEDLATTGLNVAKILDEDVGRAVRGVGQLVRTGLVADAGEGFDLITAAAQELPAEFRGELIDTVEEYASSFAELGLTGPQALGALNAAVEAGARNTDFAADAFKEFSIRAIDGSKLSSEAFQALGFDAQEMTQQIANGGPAAAQATSDIIRAISGIGDQALQEQVGVALFGTKFEDLGIDVIRAMDPAGAALTDFAGAAAEAGDVLNDNLAFRLEALKRRGFQGLATVAGATVVPLLEYLFDLGEQLGPVFSRIGGQVSAFLGAFRTGSTDGEATPIERLALSLRDEVLPVLSDAREVLTGFGQTVTEDVVPALASFAGFLGEAFAEVAPVIAPILGQVVGIVVDAVELIAAVTAGFVAVASFVWAKWGDEIMMVVGPIFRAAVGIVSGTLDVIQGIIRTVTALIQGDWEGAWEGIKQIFDGVWGIIVSIVENAFDLIVNIIVIAIDGLASLIVAGFRLHFDVLLGYFGGLVDAVADLPGQIARAAVGLWDGLVAPFEDAVNAIRSLWNRTLGGFGFTLPGFLGGGSISIPELHSGGVVDGRPGQEGLFLLQAGETVIPDDISTLDSSPLPTVESFGRGGDVYNITMADGQDLWREVDLHRRMKGRDVALDSVELIGADQVVRQVWPYTGQSISLAPGQELFGLAGYDLRSQRTLSGPGVTVNGVQAKPRRFVVPVLVQPGAGQSMVEALAALGPMLSPDVGTVRIRVSRPDGTTRELEAYYQGGGSPTTLARSGHEVTEVRLLFEAPSPYWRPADGTEPAIEGTFSDAWFAGADPIEVVNDGDVWVWPEFQFVAPLSNIEIFSLTAGRGFHIPNTLTTEQVNIDTSPEAPRVLLNWDPATEVLMSPAYEFFPLRPGRNRLMFRARGQVSGSTPTGVVGTYQMRWQPRFETC